MATSSIFERYVVKDTKSVNRIVDAIPRRSSSHRAKKIPVEVVALSGKRAVREFLLNRRVPE